MNKLLFLTLFMSSSLISCPDCLHTTTRHPETGTYQGHPVSHKTCYCSCSQKRDDAGRCIECRHKVQHHQQIIIKNKKFSKKEPQKHSSIKNTFTHFVNFLTQKITIR